MARPGSDLAPTEWHDAYAVSCTVCGVCKGEVCVEGPSVYGRRIHKKCYPHASREAEARDLDELQQLIQGRQS